MQKPSLKYLTMSIQSEINNDSILNNWMNWDLDSKHFEHQLEMKFTAIRIALNRKLNKL